MREDWRLYKGKYAISNLGNVMNLKTGKRLKPQLKHGRGYLYVSICFDGQRKSTYVHRMVAEMFLERPLLREDVLEVNHKNGIKTDNRASNLEWVSHRENIMYNYYSLGFAVKPVEVKHFGKVKGCFPSIRMAARYFNIPVASLWYGYKGWSIKLISIDGYNDYVENTLMQPQKYFRYARR